MEFFKQNGEFLEKYSIVSVDRDRVYKDKKRFGKWYSEELLSLVEKLLDGDYTVTAKIMNLPPQKALVFKIKPEEWIKSEFTGENMLLEDYYRAIKFFNDFRLPNVSSEDDNTVKLFNGFYYNAEDTRLVKYGVKFDTERLVKLRVHILAVCNSRDNSLLVDLIDDLLNGDYSVVPEILAIARKEQPCSCPGVECSQYYSALRAAIKVEEFVSISNTEFEEFTKFLNMDCPEDHAPVKPKEKEDIGDPFKEEQSTGLIPAEMLADMRMIYYRQEMEKALQEGRKDDVLKFQNFMDSLVEAFNNGTLQPQGEKQM